MNIDSLKLEYLAHKIQIVSFGKDGNLLETCNSIINLSTKTNLFDQIIFLEGVKESLVGLTLEDSLDFNCISNPFGNDCAYDFTFELEDNDTIIWYISDYTPQYNKLRDLQQGRNENVIRKEKLNSLNRKLSIENELINENPGATGSSNRSNIFIKIDSLLVNFNLSDICLAEAYGDYVKILDKDKKSHIVYSTLKKIEDKLPKSDFVRVHRSFIVRLDNIENVDNSNMLVNDRVVPISKKYKSEFLDRLNTL